MRHRARSIPRSDDAGQYLNALHFGDAALGKLLDGLRARGLDTNTLFVIYGDHGEAFGQHEGNYGHTLFLYEENICVPLVVALPGALHEAKRVKRTASLIDVAPTLLDLLGLKAPEDYQGASLLEPRNELHYSSRTIRPADFVRDALEADREVSSSRVKLFDLRRTLGHATSRDNGRNVMEWAAPRRMDGGAEVIARPDDARAQRVRDECGSV